LRRKKRVGALFVSGRGKDSSDESERLRPKFYLPLSFRAKREIFKLPHRVTSSEEEALRFCRFNLSFQTSRVHVEEGCQRLADDISLLPVMSYSSCQTETR